MHRYIGTKILKAKAMTRGEYNAYRGWTSPANENPADTGYLVEYEDGGKPNDERHGGYISWSPSDVFERSYRLTDGMAFGDALAAIQLGQRIQRTGWNGRGMYVFFVPYPPEGGATNPYMALCNPNGSVSTWVPSVSDCIATDWRVVPR
jgi:hypothetical protein